MFTALLMLFLIAGTIKGHSVTGGGGALLMCIVADVLLAYLFRDAITLWLVGG